MDIPRLPLPVNVAALGQIRRGLGLGLSSAGDGRLTEQPSFGADPGGLRMLSYVPPGLAPGAPLVVLLHGCTQTGGGFDAGTGWSVLAERHGFALLVPEQRRANNPNLCFNWFEPADTTRGSGEAASIRAMVADMVARHRLDAARVFVTGLSAGGALTAALLATYPDVFAAGAVIAGLPFGCATNVREAMSAMAHCPAQTAGHWGDLVRHAAPSQGGRPRIALWHGDADTTVAPGNAVEAAKQWCDVHGLRWSDGVEDTVEGIRHTAWRDRTGTAQVELFRVAGLGHGAPVDTAADGDRGVGKAMAHVPDCGVPSTWHIARGWGLVPESPARAAARPKPGLTLGAKEIINPKEIIAKALRASGLLG